jgi:hypothetical protein
LQNNAASFDTLRLPGMDRGRSRVVARLRRPVTGEAPASSRWTHRLMRRDIQVQRQSRPEPTKEIRPNFVESLVARLPG